MSSVSWLVSHTTARAESEAEFRHTSAPVFLVLHPKAKLRRDVLGCYRRYPLSTCVASRQCGGIRPAVTALHLAVYSSTETRVECTVRAPEILSVRTLHYN